MSDILKFIHIGLPKCASTFFQSVWGQDPAYKKFGAEPFVKFAQEASLQDSFQIPKIGPFPEVKSENAIASSEGFTWAYLNDPEKAGAIKRLHDVGSQVLNEAGLSTKILVLVRDPVKWMRSCHEQSIKEGGFHSFLQFRDEQRRFITDVLDLKHLMDAYGRFFDVTILSIDELREDEEGFYQKYTEKLNVPVPTVELDNGLSGALSYNSSVGGRVQALASLNEYRNKLKEVWDSCSDDLSKVFAEETRLITHAMETMLWANRRIAEVAGDEEFEALVSLLNTDDNPKSTDVLIDQPLYDFIEENYIQVLETIDTIPAEILGSYRTSLKDALQTE